MIDRRKLWYLKNKDKVHARARAIYRKRYATDPEYRKRLIKYTQKSYAKYRPDRLEYKKRYHKYNKENNVQYKLKQIMRHRINNAIEAAKCERLYSYETLIGCSYEFLQKYLESKFKPGMTWKNHGFKSWHIDHIKEICSFELEKGSDQKKAFNYKNLQPLWAHENWDKSNHYISKLEKQIKLYRKQNKEYRKVIRELINKAQKS